MSTPSQIQITSPGESGPKALESNTTHSESVTTFPNVSESAQLITARMSKDPFVWLAIGLFLIAAVAICAIFAVVYSHLPGKEVIDEQQTRHGLLVVIFAARLMQTTLGMLLGMLFALLGAIMAWHGVTGEITTSMTSAPASAKLATASPGLVLVLCGTVIISFCLFKEFKLEAEEP